MGFKLLIASAIPNKHLMVIGRITVNFALLESSISMGIWKLIGAGQEQDFGKIITSELSFKNLVALFSSLFNYLVKDQSSIDQLKNLIKDAMEAEKKRNIITHSLYVGDKKKSEVIRIKTTAKIHKGLKYQLESLTVNELNEIADFIAEVTANIQSFVSRIKLTDVWKTKTQ
ncbi:MAG: hypothetical protein H8D45_25320 [Bacteroidetes bacterium]|nr:hypothetical protein [Bacteroidota bacterium]